MKNSKKVFILTESVLGILVIILAVVMLMGRNGKELHKVSVIVENSDDNQWAAFRYGLRMAAEDQEMEISVVSTEGTMTLEEQQALAQQEIDNGADGIIAADKGISQGADGHILHGPLKGFFRRFQIRKKRTEKPEHQSGKDQGHNQEYG